MTFLVDRTVIVAFINLIEGQLYPGTSCYSVYNTLELFRGCTRRCISMDSRCNDLSVIAAAADYNADSVDNVSITNKGRCDLVETYPQHPPSATLWTHPQCHCSSQR